MRIRDTGAITVGGKPERDLDSMTQAVIQSVKAGGTDPYALILDPSSELPFAKVLPIFETLMRHRILFVLQAPAAPDSPDDDWWYGAEAGGPPRKGLSKRLHEECKAVRDRDGLARVVIKIVVEPGVTYSQIQQVLVNAMENYIWRITLTRGTDAPGDEIGPRWDRETESRAAFPEQDIIDVPLTGVQ